MAVYDGVFFEYVDTGALRSAHHVLPLLTNAIPIHSVLDVGCARGAWLSVWRELGVADVAGIDGDYVDRSCLRIPAESFSAHDLTRSFDVGRRFDLVQSLEVAEHLPASSASGYIKSLVRHAELILFSSAPKGQGGTGHINEQDYEYWRRLFAEAGYFPIDYLRPIILVNKAIEPWYRYNTLLYVSQAMFPDLPETLKNCRVRDGEKIRDPSPLAYKVRKAIIRCLPVTVVTALAKIHAWHAVKGISARENQSPP